MILYQIGDDTPEETPDKLYWSILPIEPLPELPAIKPGDLVVIEGQAPIWRYCIALHKLHDSAAGAIGILIPQLGIIIVVSHLPNYQVGDILQQD